MGNTIEITRKQLERWRSKILEVKVEDYLHDDSDTLFDILPEMDVLLATSAQPISPLQAEVMALQPAPFISSPLGKTIVDANNKAIGYARGMTILQQDEMHNMVCEALNEYWAKHKV